MAFEGLSEGFLPHFALLAYESLQMAAMTVDSLMGWGLKATLGNGNLRKAVPVLKIPLILVSLASVARASREEVVALLLRPFLVQAGLDFEKNLLLAAAVLCHCCNSTAENELGCLRNSIADNELGLMLLAKAQDFLLLQCVEAEALPLPVSGLVVVALLSCPLIG